MVKEITNQLDCLFVNLLKTIVEWSLQDIQKPLGVASYQLQLIQGCSRICIGGVILLVKSSLKA